MITLSLARSPLISLQRDRTPLFETKIASLNNIRDRAVLLLEHRPSTQTMGDRSIRV